MYFTLGQAAKETGKSKGALSKDVANGKISATKQLNGSYQIEASELFRVYPKVSEQPSETGVGNGPLNDPQPTEVLESGLLRAEISRLREQLQAVNLERSRERDQLTDQIEDLRQRLDKESEERRAMTTRLLTYQQPPAPLPRRSWLSKLRRSAP